MNWNRYCRIIPHISPQQTFGAIALESDKKQNLLRHTFDEYLEATFLINWIPKSFTEMLKNADLVGHDYERATTIKAKIQWFRETNPYINALKIQFPDYQFKRKISTSVTGCVLKVIHSLNNNQKPMEYAVKVFKKEHRDAAL